MTDLSKTHLETAQSPSVLAPAALPDLFLVVPVYNESANLPALRQRIASVCRGLGLDWRVLWIDDCSTDASRDTIAGFKAADPGHDDYLFRETNQGIAAAWRDCFAGSGRVVGLIPSDGQFAPEDLAAVIEAFNSGDCDAVVVTRPRRADKPLRALVSRIARVLEHLFLGNPWPDIHWVHFWRGGLLDGIDWHARTTAIDAEWSWHIRRRVSPERIRLLGLPHHPRTGGRATAGRANMNMLVLNLYTFADLARTALKIAMRRF